MYDRRKANEFLEDYYNLEELWDLCFRYLTNIPRNFFNKNWSPQTTIREILDYCEKNSLQNELLRALKETRENSYNTAYLSEAADKLLSKLKKSFSQAKKEEVQATWQEIRENDFDQFLSPEGKNLIERLLLIVASDENLELSETEANKYIQDNWLSELVGAIICAEDFFRQHGEKYKGFFLSLMIDPISHVKLHDRFIELARDIIQYPLEGSSPEIVLFDKEIDSPLYNTAWKRVSSLLDPLLHTRAEDEQATLCEDEAFWPDKKGWGEIFDATESQIIFGQSGSGRTALANIIRYWEYRNASKFSLYVSVDDISKLSLEILYKEMAKQLWDYICAKPTLLILLHEDQRTLLGSVLAHMLTTIDLCNDIDTVIAKDEWWIKSPIEMNKLNKEHRQVIGKAQLNFLKKAIEDFVGKKNFNEMQWLYAFIFCVESFGFPTIRLLLDFSALPHYHVQNFMSIFLRKNENLYREKLTTTLFMPTPLFEKIKIKNVSSIKLDWDKDELKAMITYRFKALSNGYPHLFFDSVSTYDAFISSIQPITPRRAVQMWRASLEELGVEDGELITINILQRAKIKLEARENDL